MELSLTETMTSRNGMLLSECEQVNLMVEDKYFQFLWTCSPDHENIVHKSKPQVWLMGWVKERRVQICQETN